MSPEQCRAARGWLGWSQQQLADKAGIGVSTVRTFEDGSEKPIPNNLAAIQWAVEGGGLDLLFDKDGLPNGIKIR